MAPTRREWLAFAGILLVGLALRAFWLLDASALPFWALPQTDDYVYAHGAARIAAGDFWLAGEPLRFGPPYFYFLALTGSALAPRVVQLFAGMATVLCVAWTTREITRSNRAALIAAALSAIYAPAIFFETLLLPETLMALVHAALAVVVVRAIQKGDQRAWSIAGVLLGIATAFRPNAALLIAPLLFFAGRRHALALISGALVGVAPLLVRNMIAIGTPLSASTAGINAFIGNGPGATGVFRVPDEVPGATSAEGQFNAFRAAASSALGHSASDGEADRYWLARTLDQMLADPLHAAVMLARKTRLFWNTRELSNLAPFEFLSTLGNTLSLPLARFGWIAPLGFAGMFVLATPKRAPAERATAWLLITGSLSVIVLFVQDRYRIPLVPWVIVVAVVTGKALVDLAREKHWRALALCFVPVLVGVALAYPPIALREQPEREWTALADGYRELGLTPDACTGYRHALAIDASFAPAMNGARDTCR